MRWYGWLFLFALLLFIGSHYNWFGFFKTDLDKANDKFKEIYDSMAESSVKLSKMSDEEREESKKKMTNMSEQERHIMNENDKNKVREMQIRHSEEYENIFKKLSKPDIIPHVKYISNIVLEDYKNLVNLSDRMESLAKTDKQAASKLFLSLWPHGEYYGKLKDFYMNIIRRIIQDNPDLEKDLSEIGKQVRQTQSK